MKYFPCLFVISLLSLTACKKTCTTLPDSFSSIQEAKSQIKSASFYYSDSARSFTSEWVSKAEFLSCDKEVGFFTYDTRKGQSYTHQGVPMALWKEYKKAESKGTFINRKLKGKYRLVLK